MRRHTAHSPRRRCACAGLRSSACSSPPAAASLCPTCNSSTVLTPPRPGPRHARTTPSSGAAHVPQRGRAAVRPPCATVFLSQAVISTMPPTGVLRCVPPGLTAPSATWRSVAVRETISLLLPCPLFIYPGSTPAAGPLCEEPLRYRSALTEAPPLSHGHSHRHPVATTVVCSSRRLFEPPRASQL